MNGWKVGSAWILCGGLAGLLVFGCGGGAPAKSDQAANKAPAKQMAKKPAAKPAQHQEPAAKPQAAKPAAAKPAAPAAAKPAASGNAGTINGRIGYDGSAPAPAKLEVNKDTAVCAKTEKTSEKLLVSGDGGLANAVVYLKTAPAGAKAEVPAQNPLIDQLGCRYEPHVLLVPAGTTIDIKNSDGILHNLHTYSSDNPAFNAAQPKFKKIIRKKLDKAEFIRLTCDVHGWMEAWIVVHNHPFFALTGADGSFELTGVPPGDYEVGIWHESLGEHSGKVSVQAGAPATFNIAIAAS